MTGVYWKTFFRGSTVSLLGMGAFGVINYLIRRKLSIDLPVAEYGAFYSMFALLSLVFGIADIGLSQSGTLMIAAAWSPRRRDAVFSQLFLIKMLLSAVCAGGVCLVYEWTGRAAGLAPGLLLLTVFFALQTLNGTLQALWNGLKKFASQQFFLLLTAGLTLVMLYGFGMTGTLKRITLCFTSASGISLAAGLVYSRIGDIGHLRLRIRWNICRALFVTGGKIAVTAALLSFVYHMDTIMLNALRGPSSAGLYNVALPLMQIVQSLMVFPAVFLPIAVDMERKREFARLLRFVVGAHLAAVAAVVPVWGFFQWSGAFLIRFLFDEKYVAAAPAATLLCVGLLFFTLGNFLMQILFCLRKTGWAVVISGIVTMLNFGLNYLFILKWDIHGAAAATLVSHLVYALLTGSVLIVILKRRIHAQRNQELFL